MSLYDRYTVVNAEAGVWRCDKCGEHLVSPAEHEYEHRDNDADAEEDDWNSGCLNPIERPATPWEVDHGCELGVAYDRCGECDDCARDRGL